MEHQVIFLLVPFKVWMFEVKSNFIDYVLWILIIFKALFNESQDFLNVGVAKQVFANT